ncbi:MAG: hypothetical protein ACTSV5_13785 [Promethearchaeota archaeon]
MKKFSKMTTLRTISLGTLSFAWVCIAIQALIGTLSFSPFGFFN